MSWQIIVALVVMIPVILLPVAFVWFLNFGGLASARKKMRETQTGKERLETNSS
jgi:hypothetical protein